MAADGNKAYANQLILFAVDGLAKMARYQMDIFSCPEAGVITQIHTQIKTGNELDPTARS